LLGEFVICCLLEGFSPDSTQLHEVPDTKTVVPWLTFTDAIPSGIEPSEEIGINTATHWIA